MTDNNYIVGEVPINPRTGRAIAYSVTKKASDGLIQHGIDIEEELKQAVLKEIENDKKLLDESPTHKPQLIEDIRGGKRL